MLSDHPDPVNKVEVQAADIIINLLITADILETVISVLTEEKMVTVLPDLLTKVVEPVQEVTITLLIPDQADTQVEA